MTQRFDVAIDPLDAIVETLIESDSIAPTESIANFSTIKHIGCVLTWPITYHFYGRVEQSAHFGANPFNELTDGYDLIGRDVISFTWRRICHDAPSRIRNILYMDKG